jgi:tRNA modification GTPase
MLVDTPGIRGTDDAIEQAAIERSRSQIERADLIMFVLDASGPEGEQIEMLKSYCDSLVIANKIDRAIGWINDVAIDVATVATIGQGVDELRRAIVTRFCGEPVIVIDRPRCWTDRQAAILNEAYDSRQRFAEV